MCDKRIWINRTIDLLEKNSYGRYTIIAWCQLSQNPNAISILEKNQNRICWEMLSHNPNAIHLLEKNQDKISWGNLSRNEGIYEINYKFLKERMDIIREDLMKAVYHPKRLEYYLGLGYNIFDE